MFRNLISTILFGSGLGLGFFEEEYTGGLVLISSSLLFYYLTNKIHNNFKQRSIELLEVLPDTLPSVADNLEKPESPTLNQIKEALIGTSYLKSKEYLQEFDIILTRNPYKDIPFSFFFWEDYILPENVIAVKVTDPLMINNQPTKNTVISNLI